MIAVGDASIVAFLKLFRAGQYAFASNVLRMSSINFHCCKKFINDWFRSSFIRLYVDGSFVYSSYKVFGIVSSFQEPSGCFTCKYISVHVLRTF
jgi:hypothetical protein